MSTKPKTWNEITEEEHDENKRQLGLLFDIENKLSALAKCAILYEHSIFFGIDSEACKKRLTEAISEWRKAERVQRASEKSKPRLRQILSP